MQLEEKFKEASSLLELEEFDKAESVLKEIIKIMPQNDGILVKIFKIYYERKEYDKAIDYLLRAIKIDPCPIYYAVLGKAYYKTKNCEKAKACYLHYLKTKPDDVAALFDIGIICAFSSQYEEAEMYFNKVLEKEPSDASTYYNLAIVYKDQFNFDKTIEYLLKAIEFKPDYAKAIFFLGETFLKLGNFVDGWKLYESRFYNGIDYINSSKPEWDGSSLENKTIYLRREQGFGDCIMFARFIPVLSQMGAKVLFNPHDVKLEELFKDSELPAQIIDSSTPMESLEFDTHLNLMSLAHILQINEENIPYKDKYLKANPKKVKKYKKKYFNNDKFKIGIVWQCKNLYDHDFSRSIPDISYLFPLIRIPGTKIYSIQKGLGEEQLKNLPEGVEITELGTTFENFSDTAAAIENLDLVVSVDTSVVHLAGALGKETLVLLDYLADWKWLLERDDCIWYDKMRLFRQDKNKNWEYVINNVIKYIIQKYNLESG